MKNFRRIVWAVDPFESDQSSKSHSVQFLKNLAESTSAQIYPVHIVSDGLLGLSVSKSILTKQYMPWAENALNKFLEKTKMPRLASSHAIVCASSSHSRAADTLDRFARKLKADAIFVSSNGRKGITRAILGSFAETLVLHAKTPVILSGPKNVKAQSLKHILYPTDLSAQSSSTFKRVLNFAKEVGAELTVFYAASYEFEMVLQSQAAIVGGGWIPMRNNPSITKQRKQAETFKTMAKNAGVKANIVFDLDTGSVTRAILNFAKKKKPALIAMASESSVVSAAVLGSIGRIVARESPCAVWFFRS